MIANLTPFKNAIGIFLVFASIAPDEISAQPADTNYDETKVPAYTLPELLKDNSGNPVTTSSSWINARREQVLNLLELHVYGKTPETSTLPITSTLIEKDPNALHGNATRKQIRFTIGHSTKITVDLLVYHPNLPQPTACFMGLNFYGNQTIHQDPNIVINPRWMRGNADIGIRNHRATAETRGVYTERWQVEKLINRGYAIATVYCGDFDPDNYQHDYSDGIQPLLYQEGQSKPGLNDWGTIGVWAWGLSRMLDHLIESEDRIDSSKVAVIGHSRLGKTALWAGAQDERFSLVISNNSGCGGAALYRREFGERIHHMLKPVGYWFSLNHAQYAKRERELPADQHMLLALVAPRPLYVASATQDEWADPKGEFLAATAASPVYQLFGLAGLPESEFPAANHPIHGDIGYHLREGKHDITEYDWDQYLTFAELHWGEPHPPATETPSTLK